MSLFGQNFYGRVRFGAEKAFAALFDFVFPKEKFVRELETASLSDFADWTETARRKNVGDTISLFDYQHEKVKSAVRELKYRGNRQAAKLFASLLYEELAVELSERALFQDFGKPLLIPIPLGIVRRRERGFNQCELLAEEMAKLDGGNLFTPSFNTLMKIKDTESQTTKSRGERLKNLARSFAVRDGVSLRGVPIILLDDVTTTGATLAEAKKALRRAGARKILALTVAH